MKHCFLTLLAMCAAATPAHAFMVQGVERPDLGNRKEMAQRMPRTSGSTDGWTLDFDKITNWSGTGTNQAALVVQWADGTSYAFGYRFNDSEANGLDMVKGVVAANPQLYALLDDTELNDGTGVIKSAVIGGFGFDVNADRDIFVSNSGRIADGEDGVLYCGGMNNYDYDDWNSAAEGDLWDSGWKVNGFWQYSVSDSGAATPEYSQVGSALRKLTDGCVDCWMFIPFSGDTPELKPVSYAPAEEPAYFKHDGLWYDFVIKRQGTVRMVRTLDTPYDGTVNVPGSITLDNATYTVTELGSEAFANAAATEVTLPASVTRLRDRVFAGCDGVAKFTCMATTPPTLGSDVFAAKMLAMAALTVPEEAAETYALADGWRDFADNVAVTPPAIGDIFEYDRVLYRVNSVKGSEVRACVTSKGSSSLDKGENRKFYVGDITVHDNFKYHGATIRTISVDSRAFAGASELTGVDMSELDLGTSEPVSFFSQSSNKKTQAFEGCTSLTSVKLPKQGSIILMGDLFKGCTALKSVTFGKSFYRAYDSVFEGCTSLEEISMPQEGHGGIDGSNLFKGCTSLRKVTLSKGWSYGNPVNLGMFDGCTALEEVTLQQNCGSVQARAFRGCENLRIIRFADKSWSKAHPAAWHEYSTSSFAEAAFENCRNLELEIPSTVIALYKDALKGCEKIRSIDFSKTRIIESGAFDGSNISEVCLTSEITKVQPGIFGAETPADAKIYVCSTTPLSGVDPDFAASGFPVFVPFGTKSLFKDTYTSADIREIEPTLLFGISNPSATIQAEPYVSESTHALIKAEVKISETTPAIPELFKAINSPAYIAAGAIELAIRPQGSEEWSRTSGTYSAGAISKDLEGLDFATTYEYFWSEKGAQAPDVTMTFATGDASEPENNSALRIGNIFYTFHKPETGEPFLTVARVPAKNTQSLTNKNFYKGELTIPSEASLFGKTYPVTGLDNYSLESTPELQKVNFMAAITELPQSVLSGSGITSVEIPATVTSIGGSAFANTPLTSLVIPEGVTLIGSAALLNTPISELEIPSSVTEIGKSAFEGMKKLTKVSFKGASIAAIPAEAFQGCESLDAIIIPDGVTSIGDYAFNKCTSLKTVEVPACLETIGNYSFWECPSLYSFTQTGKNHESGLFYFPDSLKKIGDSSKSAYSGCTFRDCKLMTDVRLPESLEHICSYAFEGTSLHNVTIPEAMTEISQYTFNRTPLEYLVIPGNISKMGTNVVMDNTAENFTIYACGLEPIPADKMDIRSISIAYKQNPPIIVPPGTSDAYKAVRTWWYDQSYISNTSITEAVPTLIEVTTDVDRSDDGFAFTGIHRVTFDAEYPEQFRKELQGHYSIVLEHKPMSAARDNGTDDEWSQVETTYDNEGNLAAAATGLEAPFIYRWHAIHPNGPAYDLFTEPSTMLATTVSETFSDASVSVVGRRIICKEGSRIFGMDGTEYGDTALEPGIYVVVTGNHSIKVAIN